MFPNISTFNPNQLPNKIEQAHQELTDFNFFFI
jgi:hypothetical protein